MKTKNKIKIFIILLVIITLGLSVQFYLFYNEKLNKNQLKFESLGWSENCEGDDYTAKDKQNFCDKCLKKTDKCDWPLDINVSIENIKNTLNINGEIHCYFNIDNINYYRERGSYFGIKESPFFTWQLLDSSKSHIIEFCCGIERESILNIFGFKKDLNQACIKDEIKQRCSL